MPQFRKTYNSTRRGEWHPIGTIKAISKHVLSAAVPIDRMARTSDPSRQRFTISDTRSASAAAMVPPPGAILFIT